MQDKTEWKLNGQVLVFTLPLSDQVCSLLTQPLPLALFLWSVFMLRAGLTCMTGAVKFWMFPWMCLARQGCVLEILMLAICIEEKGLNKAFCLPRCLL